MRQRTIAGQVNHGLRVGSQAWHGDRRHAGTHRLEAPDLRELVEVVRQRYDFEVDGWSERPRDVECTKAIAAIRRVRQPMREKQDSHGSRLREAVAVPLETDRALRLDTDAFMRAPMWARRAA